MVNRIVCAAVLGVVLSALGTGCVTVPPDSTRLKSYSNNDFQRLVVAKGYPRGKTPASAEPLPQRDGLLLDGADPSAPGAYVLTHQAPASLTRSPANLRATIEPASQGRLRLNFHGQSLLVPATTFQGKAYGLFPKPDGSLIVASGELPPPSSKADIPIGTPRQHIYIKPAGEKTWEKLTVFTADRVLDVDPDSDTLLAERVTLRHLYSGTTEHLTSRFLVHYRSGTIRNLPELSGPDDRVPRAWFLRTDPLR